MGVVRPGMLAKAALCRVSPLLIATATDDGTHLLMASGLIPGDARFFSIKARTLFARCEKAFKPFDAREADAIAEARNEYLHGGVATFTSIPEAAWWPRFWAQLAILINAQDKDLEDLVGASRVDAIEKHLAQNRKNLEHRVQMLLERAKQRLSQFESGDLPARLVAEWSRPTNLRAQLSYSTDASCPACGSQGTLEGEDVEEYEIHYEQVSEEDYDSWVDLTVGPSYFTSCPNCRLVLAGYELLAEVGLEASFETEGDPSDFVEPEYNNE